MDKSNYILTIMEDEKVPLADSGATQNYSALGIAGIVIIACLLICLIYTMWYMERKRRIMRLRDELAEYEEGTQVTEHISILHPRGLIRIEKQLEQKVAGYYMTE